MIDIIGQDLIGRNEQGELRVRIATVFPRARVIVALPDVPIHALQRTAFVEWLNERRRAEGKPDLGEEEELAEMDLAVDLFVDEQAVLIRPNPAQMELALDADELLQELVPKRLIKFLMLSEKPVREALKRRGECWRMFLPPTSAPQIRQMIAESRSALQGRPIYFYSPVSGTRFLTLENLRKLADLDDEQLRQHVAEIAAYGGRRNHHGCCEIDLFMGPHGLCTAEFDAVCDASPQELRTLFQALCERLQSTIPAEYQRDDLDDLAWRNRMFAKLMTQRDDTLIDDQSMGLDSDFSMRVEWMPGGRIEEGELIMDPAMEEPYGCRQEKQVSGVLSGLMLNLVQEYGDMEYINLGSVLPSPNRNERRGGRREVYVAQIKQRRAGGEILQIIRMQKWGVRERLDQGRSMEEAMLEAEEYTEYVLDRRLCCRQLGMNLPVVQTTRKVSEPYDGFNRKYAGRRIWSPYFQRDYIEGLATNQVSPRKLSDRSYAVKFARMLGQAAASNLIVGRAELTGQIVFDIGDEIVTEDSAGMPARIIVSDHVGALVDWKDSLQVRAAEYAAPVQRRLDVVADRRVFIAAYLDGFVERFLRVQDEYNRHRRAFDTLFKHRPWDAGGSLACRWSSILQRLRGSDARELSELIRRNIGD